MPVRAHTADVKGVALSVLDTAQLVELYGDEFENVGRSLVIEDAGNMEAFVLVGTPEEIGDFARRILAVLPVTLTETELSNLTHFCNMYEYDVTDGSFGRSADGWAWFLSGEDSTSFDLTNGVEREVS